MAVRSRKAAGNDIIKITFHPVPMSNISTWQKDFFFGVALDSAGFNRFYLLLYSKATELGWLLSSAFLLCERWLFLSTYGTMILARFCLLCRFVPEIDFLFLQSSSLINLSSFQLREVGRETSDAACKTQCQWETITEGLGSRVGRGGSYCGTAFGGAAGAGVRR